ncbi:BMP family ABC transporter substrate-binding protein [Ruminococcaceae bacterium OttesenSCG-928-D13]|nr:BMP family ABC transporter substrate-binding protein [Ruminococcaceae bacterium OttesenSCG-928-D13]
MKKRTLALILAVMMCVGLLAACGGDSSSEPASTPAASTPADSSAPADESTPDSTAGGEFAATMITDVGGINDESFNQSAWTGMEQLASELGVNTSFIESTKDADYAPNLEKALDASNDIIWGIGFMMKDAVAETAEANPDQLYALVDEYWEDGDLPNAIGVMFMAEQSSFLAGYAAGLKTETDHVGLVLGMESPVMDRFTNGWNAGVLYAANERGVDIRNDYVVAETFGDPAIGKAMAQKMYTDGADIVYSVAGYTGTGCIEAAKELDKWVIGVDMDQNKLAPDNVIASGLKNVGVGVYEVTKRVMNGEALGGTTVWLGISEGGAGLATTGGHLGSEIEGKVADVQALIADGTIEVPYTAEMLHAFTAAS